MRQRKDGFRPRGYSKAMQSAEFDIQQTVQEILRDNPSAHLAFRLLKTQCVGCPLTRFCTLKDVAEAYGIGPQVLLAALSATAEKTDNLMRSKE